MRILIADDEQGARAKVKHFLLAHGDCRVVAEAENGAEAVKGIQQHHPDLVFLDINMPELDGFDALRALDPDERPFVIFATAYDDRALAAFEVNATDYLLKPFDRTRFDAALEKVRRQMSRLEPGFDTQALLQLLKASKPAPSYPRQIMVQDRGKVHLVAVEDLDYVESAANYVTLHSEGHQHLMRTTMGALMERLDPARFFRVHRRCIVRLDAIKNITPLFKGDMELTLHSGAQVKLSRRYKDALFAALEGT